MRFDNILPINIITKLHALALVTPRLHQFKPSLKFMAARRGKKHKHRLTIYLFTVLIHIFDIYCNYQSRYLKI